MRVKDEEIKEWEEYSKLKVTAKKRVVPSMEVILSRHCIDANNPGYQKPAIRVLTLFSNGKPDYKKPEDEVKMERHRNLNKEFRMPTFNPPQPPPQEVYHPENDQMYYHQEQ